MSPLKLFEYMTSKKPIICSDLPVLREVLKNNETALLANPEDVDSWTYKIQFLIDNPNCARKISNNAYHLLLNEFTWDKRAKKISRFICS